MPRAQVTYGADPEVFFADEMDVPIPVIGLIGGSKEAPVMVKGYGLQEDNVMGEFTVPPQVSFAHLQETVQRGLATLSRVVQAKRADARVFHGCQMHFPSKVLGAAGPKAMEFGCVPDYDAYTFGTVNAPVNPKQLEDRTGAWRFAGGHIHIGYRDVCPYMDPFVAALFCDATIGLGLVASGERQSKRRALYGSPGRFRPTPYGLEYRTPANGWLFSGQLSDAVAFGISTLELILRADQVTQLRLYNEIPWNDVKQVISSERTHDADHLRRWARGLID